MSHRVPLGHFAVAAFFALTVAEAHAEDVTLMTLDRSFSVTGELVKFDGTSFTINTAIGPVMVAANMVICDGAGCPSAAPSASEFTIAGDRTLGLRLMPALLRDFGARAGAKISTLEAGGSSVVLNLAGGEFTSDAKVRILPTASGDGLDALFRGDAQFALTDRAVRAREARAFSEFGMGELRDESQETILALDGLILVTHPDNPVRAMTERDIARVFAGEISNWSDLGGRDAPIVLYSRESGSGAMLAFETRVMQPAGYSVSDGAIVFDTDESISHAVLNDLNGIGFTGFAAVGQAQALAIRGECGLQLQPTAFSIKTEEYPLTRILYMYQTSNALPGRADEFRDYIDSDAAQQLVAAAGFVNQAVTVESINSQGLRLASAVLSNRDAAGLPLLVEMVALLATADRLSTTYRFETGSARLNSRSQSDIDRLARLLATDRFANKEVFFIGFTDSVGDSELNRQLSEQRAEQVLAAILAVDPTLVSNLRMRAVGYGEISPLGCNESDTGRLINRRVEVWVRDIAEAGSR